MNDIASGLIESHPGKPSSKMAEHHRREARFPAKRSIQNHNLIKRPESQELSGAELSPYARRRNFFAWIVYVRVLRASNFATQ